MSIPAPIGVASTGQPNLGDQANVVVTGTLSAVAPGDMVSVRGPANFECYASINTSLATTAGSLSATVGSATGLANGNAINSVNVPRGTTIGLLSGTTVTLALPARFHPCFNLSLSSNQISVWTGGPTSKLLGSTVTTVSDAEQVTIPANTTVTQIIQNEIAPTNTNPGQPGIVQLSAAPTAVPPDPNPRFLRFALTGSAITASSTDANATFTGAAITFSATVQVERSFDGGRTWVVCNSGGTGTLAQYTAGPVSLTFGEPEKETLYRWNCIVYSNGTINYRISETGGAAESLAYPLSGG
jgi:hypothetical protein